MSGIREKKKRETRTKILKNAEALFKKMGYKNVTTLQIAKECGIGEGTLFNYYTSKGELFIAALFGDMSKKTYSIDFDKSLSEKALIEEIMRIIDFYVHAFRDIDRSLLQEYYAIAFNPSDKNASLQSIAGSDQIIATQILKLLELFKTDHHLTFDAALAVSCIYGLSNTASQSFVYAPDMHYDQMMQDLKAQITFLMSPYLSASSISAGKV